MFIRPGDLAALEVPPKLLEGAAPMASLIGLNGPFESHQYPIRADRTIIGNRRHFDHDIVLADPTVSMMHARIVHQHGQWRVTNMLSTNGTFVNGEKVRESAIDHGDKLRFGRVELVFQNIDRKPPAKRGRAGKNRVWVPSVLRWLIFCLVVVLAASLVLL